MAKLLALDVSERATGWVLVECEAPRQERMILRCGCIVTKPGGRRVAKNRNGGPQ